MDSYMLQCYWVLYIDEPAVFGDLLLTPHVLVKIANGWTPSRALMIDMSILCGAIRVVSDTRCIKGRVV